MNQHEDPTPTCESPITSIQPGGGLVFSLERAWGRFRRSVLRLLFPGHVARMRAVRQGECAGNHDVIDSRDLKLVRNVCGYSFPEKDDSFAWRGRIGLARAGLAEVVVFSLILWALMAGAAALGALVHPGWYAALAVPAVLWVFILSFFRDPERRIPTDADALVSPADGVVTHVETVDDADFPGGKAFRISIFLSVFNVHVNRLPRNGRVTRVRYFPGEFLDARHTGCAQRNEQLWVDLQDDALGCPVRVKQVAGAIARRIVCWLRDGEPVRAGDRYGMIKFGSRTDVLLPPDVVREVRVRVGQAVRGGSDVLLRVGRSEGAP